METLVLIGTFVGIAIGLVMIITFFEMAADLKKIRKHLIGGDKK